MNAEAAIRSDTVGSILIICLVVVRFMLVISVTRLHIFTKEKDPSKPLYC